MSKNEEGTILGESAPPEAPPAPEFSLADLVSNPDVVAAIAASPLIRQVIAEGVKEGIAAEKALAGNKPPLGMRAKIADRFITESNAKGATNEPLKHYRCDRLRADKLVEIDLNLLAKYESGKKAVPENKRTGRERSALNLSSIPGSFISFVDGHCYCYTENQVANIERLRQLPRELGGIPDCYEHIGAAVSYCHICPPGRREPFTSMSDLNSHIAAVHQNQSIVVQAAP
jgi:hypothetical protein